MASAPVGWYATFFESYALPLSRESLLLNGGDGGMSEKGKEMAIME